MSREFSVKNPVHKNLIVSCSKNQLLILKNTPERFFSMQNAVKIAGYDSLEEAMIGISKIYKLLAGNCEDENSIDKEEMQKRVKDILKAVDYLEKFGDT